MSTPSPYSSHPRQTLSRKVFSSFFDGTLLTLVGAILSIIAVTSVLGAIPSFSQSTSLINTQVGIIYREYVGAKLRYYAEDENGDEIKTQVKNETYTFERWIDKQISLSYSYDQDAFHNASITIDLNQHPAASLENDEASYFFTTYNVDRKINSDLYGEETPLDYFKEKQLFACLKKDYFVDESGQLPHLTADCAIALDQAIAAGEQTDLYQAFSTGFGQINAAALAYLLEYPPIADGLVVYNAAYLQVAQIELVALIIVFALAFFLVMILPQLLISDHVTLGNLFTKTRRIGIQGEKPSVWALTGKNLLTFLRGAIAFFVIGLIAFDFSIYYVPLFSLGSLELNVFAVVGGVSLVEIVNAGFGLFRKDHRSLEELATRTELVTKEMDFEKKEEDDEVDSGGKIETETHHVTPLQ